MAWGAIRIRGRAAAIASLAVVGLLTAFAGSAHAANFTVTNTNPSGAGSLAEAITLANADLSTADTIQITATGTIKPSGFMFIGGTTEIDGPGARSLTIDAQNTMRLFVTNGNPTLTLTGMTLANALNNSSLYYGSAILARDGGQVILRNMEVLNNTNTAVGNDALGGAIYSRGPLTIENSTFAGNKVITATSGVAVGGAFYAPGGATVRSSTFFNNTASGATAASGGAGYFDGPTPSVVRNSTFASNISPVGANVGIGTTHHISFRDNILSSPLGGGADCDAPVTATVTSEGFNLISDAGCGLVQPTDLAGDPQLGPLADNGGPTDTMLPAATSPVIDHGTSSGITTDQRGLPRPADIPTVANGSGDLSDIGAVEIQPVPAPPPPAAGDVTLGKVQLNKSKGTATILTTVNGAGKVVLAGKTVKNVTASPTAAGKVKLTIKAIGKSKRALGRKRKAKVAFTVTFTPASGGAVDMAKRSVTLKLKPKPKRHHP